MYKLLNDSDGNNNQVLHKETNRIIPFDQANTDYQEYLEWVAEGGVIEEADV